MRKKKLYIYKIPDKIPEALPSSQISGLLTRGLN